MTWEDIPGFFDFQDIYDEAVATAPPKAVLVELGTLFGKSTMYMAEQIKAKRPDLKFYTVDKWEMWPDVIWGHDTAYSAVVRQHGGLYEAFQYFARECGLGKFVTVIRCGTVEAAARFVSKRPYFVYIDADHSYEGALADIRTWDALVPAGGIIAGHDRERFPTVEQAVKEHFGPDGYECRGKWPNGDSWLVRK